MHEITKIEREYNEKYAHLPYTQNELIDYIKNNFRIDIDKYKKLKEYNDSLHWNMMSIRLDIPPKPTPRARRNGNSGLFYVKNSGEHKKIIRRMIDNESIICTKTEFLVQTYQPTPNSMTNHEILAAEEKIIQPVQNPDWDNLGKTYSDMVQNYLLLNDNIIVSGHVDKYYSIRPRVEIFIRYQSDYDCNFNKNKIEKSKMYQTMIEEAGKNVRK